MCIVSKMTVCFAAALFLIVGEVLAAGIPKVIDLSYTYDKDTPTAPGLLKFKLKPVDSLKEFGVWSYFNNFCTSEHSGTHLDAPAHFALGARTLDNIAPEKIYRIPGVKMDLRHKITHPNYGFTDKDIEEWIKENGPLPDGAVVLFQTGYGEKAHDPKLYAGIDENGKANFPSLDVKGAGFLVNYKNSSGQKQGVIGVGLDVISLDVGNSTDFPSHKMILKNDLYGIENVANVHLLPNKGFYLTILPIKIGNGSGGPTRIIAELTPNEKN